MQFSTFIPKGGARGCVIFLAGLTCTPESFIAKAGAQKFLARPDLMVVCPDTSPRGLQLPHARFYVDATTPGYANHYRMDRYVTGELHALSSRSTASRSCAIRWAATARSRSACAQRRSFVPSRHNEPPTTQLN